MFFGYLFTSFMDFCASDKKSESEKKAKRLGPPAACAACPYGRKTPCSAARQADCIYISKTLPIWDGSF